MVHNYQKELDSLIESLVKNKKVPTLLLHSCCAPCSSYVLEYLSAYFKITVFYYNPNIYPQEEYQKRVVELKRLIAEIPLKNEVKFIEGKYDSDSFFALAKGLEQQEEGGERCFRCYELRLNEAALMCQKGNYDYFTTTLSISPYKNAEKLNEIGAELAQKYGVSYLYSDFKKRGGYQRSIALSKQYSLYRQNYCGCIFSKTQADAREKERATQSIQPKP